MAGHRVFDNFVHFKACIDKDPFGAVFGRHLARHRKPIESSCLTWMFDPAPSKEGQKISEPPVVSKTQPTSRPIGISSPSVGSAPRSRTNSSENNDNLSSLTFESPKTAAKSAVLDHEYEFDPISMRNVLRTKAGPDTLAKVTKAEFDASSEVPKAAFDTSVKVTKPLFDPLFAEKGVEIPVKPYKPPQLFTYSAKSTLGNSESKDPPSDPQTLKSKAATSRLAELRKLKAASLGNSIDTTAEYHGKWVPAAGTVEKAPMEESAAVSTTPDEAPLFSGTTYEAKSNDIMKGSKSSNQGWLFREGFGTKQDSGIKSTEDDDTLTAEDGRERSPTKPQPSSDRLERVEQASAKVEPSLERLTASSRNSRQSQSSQKPAMAPYKAQESTSEDLDLLRASDIRASARTSRLAKQGSEKIKQDLRGKLEDDYKSHQKDDDGLSIVFPNTIMESSKRLPENLNNLWHRVLARQKAWLTHKVQSLSSMQDIAKEDSVQLASHKRQEALGSDVKTPATRSIQTFTPSQEVLKADQESKDRTLALRNARLEATKLEAEATEKEKALARTIKATYEDEYGSITANHRQVKGPARIDRLAKASKELNVRAARKRVKNMICRCEEALGHARKTGLEITAGIKAIRARLESSRADISQSPPSMTSDLQSTRPAHKGKVAVENPADKSFVEAKQTPSAAPKASSSRPPVLYKILAYDSSTLQMNIAETTSSTSAGGDAETQPLQTTEVLSRLNNVAKFLPYFADMEKQGYEIVSGSGDVLVFKNVRTPADSLDATAKSSSLSTEGSPKASTPPINMRSSAEPVVESLAPNASSSKIRRQEDVFSGTGQTWHQEDGGAAGSSNRGTEPGWFTKAVKRVFLTGALTAALAYTIGVAAEHAGAQAQQVTPRRLGRPGIYSTEDSR